VDKLVNTVAAEESLVILQLPQQIFSSLNAKNVALQGASFLTTLWACYVDPHCSTLVSNTSTSVENELSNLINSTYGFGAAAGTAPGATGLPDISFQSGDSFAELADSNSGYDVLLPLNDPNFSYQNAEVDATNPETGDVLGSMMVDLSSIQSSGSIQVPPIDINAIVGDSTSLLGSWTGSYGYESADCTWAGGGQLTFVFTTGGVDGNFDGQAAITGAEFPDPDTGSCFGGNFDSISGSVSASNSGVAISGTANFTFDNGQTLSFVFSGTWVDGNTIGATMQSPTGGFELYR